MRYTVEKLVGGRWVGYGQAYNLAQHCAIAWADAAKEDGETVRIVPAWGWEA